MIDTETDDGAGHRERCPVLLVGHHPIPRFVASARFVEPGDRFVVGRSSATFWCHLEPDREMSRRHAELWRDTQGLHVRDLGSRNGTAVNGCRIEEPTALERGDIVRIGQTVLVLDEASPLFVAPAHPTLLGASPALADLLRQIALVAPRHACVLVVGERGTGKALVAQEIHRQSARPGPLVEHRCGVHVGDSADDGFARIEHAARRAHGGTLYLAGVNHAGEAEQLAMLRWLRAHGEPGGAREVARVVASTSDFNHVGSGSDRIWRELLAYLVRWAIAVPPLRERRVDIAYLAPDFGARHAGHEVQLGAPLAEFLMCHDWPGNLRELDGVMERVVAESDGSRRLPRPDWGLTPPAGVGGEQPGEVVPTAERAARVSADDVVEALRSSSGNVRAAARRLGVNRSTVYRWIERADIDLDATRIRARR